MSDPSQDPERRRAMGRGDFADEERLPTKEEQIRKLEELIEEAEEDVAHYLRKITHLKKQ